MVPESAPLIALKGVWRIYAKGRISALRDVTLEVKRGEYLGIMGPSGSGKSTLLHILAGLDQPSRGEVLLEGRPLASGREWAALRATSIGFVFQAFHLLPTLTALENVEIPMFGVVPGDKERRRRSAELLEQVGLARRGSHRPAELSGGERQRVAIARSLANSPRILLADEPTGNLDSQSSTGILELLEEIRNREGITLIMATHDRAVAARGGRVLRMLDGCIGGA